MAESVRSEDQPNPPERSTKFANTATHEELHLNMFFANPQNQKNQMKPNSKLKKDHNIFNYED